MPSSGYGRVDLIREDCNTDESQAEHCRKVRHLKEAMEIVLKNGFFVEWLESFIPAWNKTQDVDIARWAGFEEWDL